MDVSQLNTVVLAVLPAPFEWCRVEGGGVDIEDYSQQGGSEGGHFTVDSFLMAKYPTTKAQFQVFIDAEDGYDDPQWWGFSNDAIQRRQERLRPNRSYYFNDHFPRSAVDWYEAMAFCGWLSAKTGLPIGLPTEQQWQRAAIGDSGWIYPWGDELNESRCNYGGKVGEPTGVTKYDAGISPFGVYDLAGNVWEWTLTAWATGDNDSLTTHGHRVVRGGSFYDLSKSDKSSGLFSMPRAATRGWSDPIERYDDQGFRIVMPLESGL